MSRRRWLWPALAVVAAAEARPLFQMPFPCGETRQGATYSGHNVHNDWPIDFNRGAGNDDEGDHVLASAAGTVRTWVESDGDTVVRVVHNADWSSEVHHLSHVDVSNGAYVQQGELIGRVGHTGTESAQLVDPPQFLLV